MQNPITTDIEPLPERRPVAQRGATSPKVLWGTIGALAVVIAALGGTMLYQHSSDHGGTPSATAPAQPLYGPEDGDRPSAALPAPARVPDTVSRTEPPSTAPSTAGMNAAPGNGTVAAAPAPARAPVCAICGRVESVRTVQHAAPPTGVGAVAGGVLGGVLGNQIGHGGGRTAATVIGAVGGGYAGHTIEKRTRTETSYQVSVRMDDGRLRTVETRTAPPIGKPVTLQGNVLRPADGRV
ncbi:glycine zipper 2TM domain-containing protein [Variovorax sp. LT1P1]|uniref:glycine zipper 2TM domain-containing protein n=1 Tax=Variovorax sp. LT1P1 TaxID=3443730 RepID=UPI003F466D94